MAKATYSVVVIRKGRERDYYDFWVRGINRNEAGEELDSDFVGFTELVEANSKGEALALIRARHSGLQVDEDSTVRHG